MALPKKKKNESYDDYVARLLGGAALSAETKKAIEALRLPAVIVATTSKAPKEVGVSRFGGDPDLPPGTKWPRNGGVALSFVAQFRLSDVARVAKTRLPNKGLLLFFVSEDMDAYLEKCAVLHVDDAELITTKRPDDFRRMHDGEPVNEPYDARGVSFAAVRKLVSPSNAVMKKMKWKGDEESIYEELFNETVDTERHQLMGYRDRSYDGEQDLSDSLLLQTFSDDRAGIEWGDADNCYFYIPTKALEKGDFSKATSYYGE